MNTRFWGVALARPRVRARPPRLFLERVGGQGV